MMRKLRKYRKTLMKRSYWNFKTAAQTMADAYKLAESDELIEDEDPSHLSAIGSNSIHDIEVLRTDWDKIQPEWTDIGFPMKINPFE